MKNCKWCNQDLELDKFGKRQTKCKSCHSKYISEYYKKFPEKNRAAYQRYKKKNRSKTLKKIIINLENKLKKYKRELNDIS